VILRRIVRYLFDHRAGFQHIVRAVAPKPILVHLEDFKIYVELDDWAIGARIALKRSYETHVSHTMRALLKPSMVMVDVGANIGYYSLLAAQRVGPTGKVIAFEPGTRSVQLLKQSATANHFANIEIHQMAVADQNGEVTFSLDDSNGGIHRGQLGVSAVLVPAIKLDDFLQAIPKIDLVKIDIEGAEGLAILGMRQLLQKHRPILFTEFTPSALPVFSGLSSEAYLNLLRQLGYDLRVIPYAGPLSPSAQTNAEIMKHFAEANNDHIDLLAQPIAQ